MARLEIPSIVVHNGSNSAPGSPKMRAQRTLSRQAEVEEPDDEQSPILNEECAGAEKSIPDGAEATPPPSRGRTNSKVKLLVRSHALREEASPPPDPEAQRYLEEPPDSPERQLEEEKPQLPEAQNAKPESPEEQPAAASLSVSRHKVRQQGSADGSSPSLSRGSSNEYTDNSGVDLQQFIRETLNKNHKDRMLLLKIEHEMLNLTKDAKRTHHKFPPMSSYQRMLVHRVAAYFGMEHNVDTTGCSVIVNKTKNMRVPEIKFREYLREDFLFPEEPRRSILKRDSSSFEDSTSLKNSSLRSSQEDFPWPSDIQQWSSTDSSTSNRLHANLLRESTGRHTRLLKVESFEGRDTLKANSLRLAVSKSYSFGGYPVSVSAGEESHFSSSGSRLLTKQDSGSSSMSSRLSPSSSGYKSQSQRSVATLSATPSPTATPAVQLTSVASPVNTEPPASQSQNILDDPNAEPVMWAVSDLSSIPPGSILINHQTLEAYTNPDGSLYRFDPQHPPKIIREDQSLRISRADSPESDACSQTEMQQCKSHKGSVIREEHSMTVVRADSQESDAHSEAEQQQGKKAAEDVSPDSEEPMKHVSPVLRTTATSPSLPVTPPAEQSHAGTSEQRLHSSVSQISPVSQAPTLVQPHLMTVCHTGPCPYVTVQPDQPVIFHNTPQYLQPIGVQPGEVYGTPVGNQTVTACPLQPSQLVYASYSVPVAGATNGVPAVYDTRLLDGGTVTELNPCMLSLSLSDQRTNCDSAQQASLVSHGHTYQTANSYWHQQLPSPFQPPAQAVSGVPLFYVPSPPTSNVLSSSVQHQNTFTTSGNSTHRLMAYPTVQPLASVHQQSNAAGPTADSVHTSSSDCPVISYGSMAVSEAGEGISLYPQPAVHMLYTSPTVNTLSTATSGGTHVASTAAVPYYASAPSIAMPSYISSGQASFHTPATSSTPTQNQAMCSVAASPFFYLNGASSCTPAQQTPGLTHITHSPTAASASLASSGHYITPVMPSLGVFHSNIQMSSPPRPGRDAAPVRSPLYRGPTPKERITTDKPAAVHYPGLPFFGVRFIPGMVRGSCPSTMRMPVAGNNISHRLQTPTLQRNSSEGSPNFAVRSQKPRKQR